MAGPKSFPGAHRWRALSAFSALLLAAPAAFADCQVQESQIQAELMRLSQEMAASSSGGVCNSVRRAIPVFQRGVQFYSSCPAADPTGQQRQALEQTLQGMIETAHAACNDS